MTTKSTAEAMAVLEATRPDLIELARITARELCSDGRTTHVKAVYDAMVTKGLTDKYPDSPPYWLGTVFRHKDFVWTGSYHNYRNPNDDERNIHERRPIKVWTLNKPAF